jgi:hypothetical protein
MVAAPGALRFNSDSQKLELFDGNQWVEIVASSPDSQTGGARGLFGGGWLNPGTTNVIEYITISTTGNSIDFGDLTVGRYGSCACSSSTRGLFAAGRSDPTATFFNVIDFITISSTGNATDGSDLSNLLNGVESVSNSTRGVFAGGYSPSISNTNVIEYVTIGSLGNAQDFGDLSFGRRNTRGSSNATRGIFSGTTSPANSNVIDFITISTTGNAADFGDLLSVARPSSSGNTSNSTRGLYAGTIAAGPSVTTNTIQYITFASLGNAIDFGDQSVQRNSLAGMSSPTRAVFAGGQPTPAFSGSSNVIDYVTIMSLGNAIDFGDLTTNSGGAEAPTGCSNGHGGL